MQHVCQCWQGQLPSLQVGISAVLKLTHENKLQLLGFLHKHSSITLKVQPQISSVSPRHRADQDKMLLILKVLLTFRVPAGVLACHILKVKTKHLKIIMCVEVFV